MIGELATKNIRYLKQLSSNYAQMVINYLIFFFLTPLMLNKLGEKQYSIWLLLSSIILYFSLSNFGLTTAFGVELPKARTDQLETNKLLNTVLFSLLAISILSSIIFITIDLNMGRLFKTSESLLYITQVTFLFFFLTFLVSFVGSLFDHILIATNHLITKSVIEILKTICIGLTSILLVTLNQSIIPIAFSNFIFTLAFFFVTFYSCKKVIKYRVNYKMFDWKLLKRILSPSWHYFVAGIAGIIVFYSDNLLISKLKGVEYVSLFAITYRLSDVCLKIIQRISSTKYPKVIALASSKDYNGILKLHNRLLLLNLAVTIPTCLFLFFFGQDLLKLWLGNKYEFNVSILRIFSVFTLFMVCSQNTGMFIGGLGIHKRFAYMGIAEASLNIILSLLFFQKFDLAGIALGTLCAHLLTNGWFGYYEFYRFILPRITKLS